MDTPLWIWISFNLFILAMIAIDLLTFHQKGKEIGIKEALITSSLWIALALLFNGLIYIYRGEKVALDFLAGYIIEKALSVDNLFVFLILFQSFRTPKAYQHQVLFWGVLGAIAMRAIMIFCGITLVTKFHWMFYIFGLFLIYAAVKMAFAAPAKEQDVQNNRLLRLLRRWIPVSDDYDGNRFFTKQGGIWKVTPLFILLLSIEFTDLVFAIDSIPAVMAITLDPFIVYTSNIFAILGLRSLYFALAGLMTFFHYLHYGLALILAFVGMKMLLQPVVDIPIEWSLGFIAATLAISVSLSKVK